jgi:hypothetical protein
MKLLVAFLFSLLFCLEIPAQPGKGNDSVIAVANPDFKTGGSRYFWMGKNYRKEWKTPVKVPVINLATEKGGLSPMKKGGGKQTKSLRLEDANGRQYTLRSIRKYVTDEALPPDLRGTFAKDLVADGISASYPYAALSVTKLSEAAGVPHGNPKIVYIPDDERLGEYRKEFANTLALFEERLPDSVSKAYDTDEVVEKLKDDNDNNVDQLLLLKTRLLDMFIMDLDRHEGQWTWGAYDNGKGKTFFPVAKDRDQAFYINEGFLPSVARWPWIAPQLEGFKASANNINRFNFAARNLDRFFLNGITEQQWKDATDELLSKMTDLVIENALNDQPVEVRNISAGKIIQTLKERRKYFASESMQYYRFLAKYVDITASDKKELFDITRNENGTLTLQVFKISKDGDVSRKMYERTFDPRTTEEIRLYGFDGDDKFAIHGNGGDIKVRMIGGPGEDVFENTSHSNKIKNIVYDQAEEKNSISGNIKSKISRDTAINNYERLGYKYNQTIPFLSVNYNADDGLFLGFSLKFIRHGFRKTPYKTMQQIAVSHALATNAYSFRYNAEFISLLGKNMDLLFAADIKAPNNTINFFGYGNNTVFDKSKPGKHKYYRARFDLGDITLLARNRIGKSVSISYGPTYEFYTLDSTDNKLRNVLNTGTNGLDPNTLYKNQSFFGGMLILNIDTRNSTVLTRKGINWATELRVLNGLNSTSRDLTQLTSDLSVYFPLGKSAVFATRFGAGHNFNGFEFYQAQYLGGTENLRGYRKYRFAGRTMAYNNNELRFKLADFRTYLFPGSLGILAFYDVGRVWVTNDTSNNWHSGYGAGFWVSPLRRLVITASYTASNEDKIPLISLGWQF